MVEAATRTSLVIQWYILYSNASPLGGALSYPMTEHETEHLL